MQQVRRAACKNAVHGNIRVGNTDDNTVHDQDEISKYLHAQSLSFKSELLEFWKGKEYNYPKLDKLARKILAIPATSASSEHNFRAVGYIIQELCTLQKPESMDQPFVSSQ